MLSPNLSINLTNTLHLTFYHLGLDEEFICFQIYQHYSQGHAVVELQSTDCFETVSLSPSFTEYWPLIGRDRSRDLDTDI